jgi:hypothetical protein
MFTEGNDNEVTRNVFVDDSDPVDVTHDNPVTYAGSMHEGSSRMKTGEPIEQIFAYLEGDYEEMGYKDALATPDTACKESTSKLIHGRFVVLLRKVETEYDGMLKKLDRRITSCSTAGLVDTVHSLQIEQERIRKYKEDLSRIGQEVKESIETSPLAAVLKSYERGFVRGLVSSSLSVLNENCHEEM